MAIKQKKPATSKTDAVIKLISRVHGASLAQLQKSTGWQPHTVRAVLSGLRKKGHTIERTKSEGGESVYRIEADADQ